MAPKMFCPSCDSQLQSDPLSGELLCPRCHRNEARTTAMQAVAAAPHNTHSVVTESLSAQTTDEETKAMMRELKRKGRRKSLSYFFFHVLLTLWTLPSFYLFAIIEHDRRGRKTGTLIMLWVALGVMFFRRLFKLFKLPLPFSPSADDEDALDSYANDPSSDEQLSEEERIRAGLPPSSIIGIFRRATTSHVQDNTTLKAETVTDEVQDLLPDNGTDETRSIL